MITLLPVQPNTQQGHAGRAVLTCVQQPQGAVWRIALVALINGCVGSLALEKFHLLSAIIHEPLAYLLACTLSLRCRLYDVGGSCAFHC